MLVSHDAARNPICVHTCPPGGGGVVRVLYIGSMSASPTACPLRGVWACRVLKMNGRLGRAQVHHQTLRCVHICCMPSLLDNFFFGGAGYRAAGGTHN